MADADLSRVIERVRKLLALSESDNPSEAANAAAAAQRLIDLHRLQQAELEVESDPGPAYDDSKPLIEGVNLRIWQRVLLSVIAQANSCVTVMRTTTDTKTKRTVGKSVVLVGRTADIQAARAMYEAVSLVLVRSASRRKHRSSWLLGAVYGVKSQIEEAQTQLRNEARADGSAAGSTADWKPSAAALAVVDQHAFEAQRFIDAHVNTKSKPMRVVIDDEEAIAYGDGFGFGKRVNLSTKVLGR